MVDVGRVPKLLRRSEAASYIADNLGLPCSLKTLEHLAWAGGGPAFRKAGRFPLYNVADLDAWAAAKLGPLVCTASEAREAA